MESEDEELLRNTETPSSSTTTQHDYIPFEELDSDAIEVSLLIFGKHTVFNCSIILVEIRN